MEVVVQSASSDELARRWPPIGLDRLAGSIGPVVRRLVVADTGPSAQLVVHVDGVASEGGWDRVESELALFAVERLTNLVGLHAGLVLWDKGALVFPGPSHAGKSTLCVAAAAAGATVLSDEFALVDPTNGLVSGWPRAVRIRRPDGAIDRADLAVASDPVPVGLVALLHYEDGAVGAWQPVSVADAVLGLLANTVCARSRPDEALDAACAVARSSPAVAGNRGEAAVAIEALLAMMDSPIR